MHTVKKQVVLFLFLFMQLFAFSQQIKKMSANDLSAYIAKSDKPLVVSFWATWCASCNEEIPYFISTIKEKYKDEVELLLVSLDIKSYYPARITAFAAKRNYSVPIVWLNEPNADVFCPKIDATWSGAIPSTVIINKRTGYKKFIEEQMKPEQFEAELKKAL